MTSSSLQACNMLTMNWKVQDSTIGIRGASSSFVSPDPFIKSPIYQEDEREWFMTLIPKKGENNFGIFLNGKDREQLKCLKAVTFSVRDQHGLIKQDNEIGIDMSAIRCGNDAIGTWKLKRESTEILRIRCVMYVEQKIETPSTESDLSRDLAQVLDGNQFTDFKIHCGKETFDCNKVILAARSNVFKTMFEQDMMESKTGEVLVKDVRPEVMEQVLKFLYTDKVDETVPEYLGMRLLYAAEKYELDGLKKICEMHLGRSINKDNAVLLLSMAKKHSADNLKNKIINWFKDVDSSEF